MVFPHFLQPQGKAKEPTRKVDFQDGFDILSLAELLQIRLSGVAKGLIWEISG
jgi:hypothetical protein